MQHVLVNLQCEKTFSYSISVFLISLFGCPGPVPRSPPPSARHWAALEHRLHKPLRYFRALARFAFISNPGNDASSLQLPSVHHHSSCDGYARDTEEIRIKNVWSVKTQSRKDWASSIPFDKVYCRNKKCKPPLITSRTKWWKNLYKPRLTSE